MIFTFKTFPTMKYLIRILPLGFLSVFSYWFHYQYENWVMLPISTIAICAFFIIDESLFRSKIKKGRFIALGKDEHELTKKLAILVIGLLCLLIGFLKGKTGCSYWGINYVGYIGIVYIIGIIFSNRYWNLILTNKYIRNKHLGYFMEKEYSEIEEIRIDSISLEISFPNTFVKYNFKDIEEKEKLEEFLKPIVSHKLILSNEIEGIKQAHS